MVTPNQFQGESMAISNRLSDLDLAALLCSRVCHDIISPVGAIANGLELMDDPETDQDMKATALDMVRTSAKAATAKLKFCRIAFGASGSAGAHIDMGEAGDTAQLFINEEKKMKLDWKAPRENRPKQVVKLLLNMLLLGMAGIPRGGMLTVTADEASMIVRAEGERAKLPMPSAEMVDGEIATETIDARLVQTYYARLLAEMTGFKLSMAMDGDSVVMVRAERIA
jgi:histidine phosphotransferase ChpT